MELITQKIRQCIEKVKDMSQVGFDRDYVIKDNKPDVSKVVCQNGQVKIDEIKASGENIWISGSIEFEVLYTREEVFEGDEPEENIGGNRVEHIKDTIPFQEKLVLQGICEKDTVRVYTGLDELTVGVINSRKLSVRGIISVELYGERVIMPEILPGFAHSLPCIRLRRKMIMTESSDSFRLRQRLRWMERSGVRKQ